MQGLRSHHRCTWLSDRLLTVGKLLLQIGIADCFRRVAHFAQQFLETSHASNDATLENIGHFDDVREADTRSPSCHNVHHVRLEGIDVILFVNIQLAFGAHFCYSPRRLLKRNKFKFAFRTWTAVSSNFKAHKYIQVYPIYCRALSYQGYIESICDLLLIWLRRELNFTLPHMLFRAMVEICEAYTRCVQ